MKIKPNSLIAFTSGFLALAIGVAGCDLQFRGHDEFPDIAVSPTQMKREDLAQIKYLQCFSNEITVSLDLSLEDLSRMPRFPKLTADFQFNQDELNQRYGKVFLGFAETGYFYEEDRADGAPTYVLQQKFEKSNGSYQFDITILSPENVRAKAKVVLDESSGSRVINSDLTCYAR